MKTFKYTYLALFIILFNCKNDDDGTSTNVNVTPTLNTTVSVYEDGIFNGYTLINPLGSTNTYLINNEGFIVNKWSSSHKGLIGYLTDEGNLVRAVELPDANLNGGGATGAIEILDFEGNQIWYWELNTPDATLHHDLDILPNGNILATLWERKSATEAIANGRDPSLLINNAVWPCKIIEITPIGSNQANIVWEWSTWDHLIQNFDSTKANFGVPSINPQLINLNYTLGGDNFNHINSINYIEEHDQILISSRLFDEVWIIDHSTTTAEAASHSGGNRNKGGDLLYRWGNTTTYDIGSDADKKLFAQHDATWIDGLPNHGGNVLVFNNNRFEEKSSIDEIAIPQNTDGSYNLMTSVSNLPETYEWSYNNEDIKSIRISGAKRLPNGNTLIIDGLHGTLYEIDTDSNIIWKFINPIEDNNQIFKVNKYPLNHPAFEGRDLVPLLDEVFN